MSRAVRVRVTGRVQGVFFRRFAAEEASRVGVTGWASNEPDGSVLVHAEGADDPVETMIAWCRDGSPAAAVERVEIEDVASEDHAAFETR